MAYRLEPTQGGKQDLVIDGFEQGIAASPYEGISNMVGVSTGYYPGVAYVNYKRKTATVNGWFAGSHSTNVSGNNGWLFIDGGTTGTIGNPKYKAVSPAGLIYILDSNGYVWKQSAVNSSLWNFIPNITLTTGSTNRTGTGSSGLAYWNNYLIIFGGGIIEFCGDGTGDSGVSALNWNKMVGYNSKKITYSASTSPSELTILSAYYSLFIGDPVRFTTAGTLPSPLVADTTYYVVSISSTTVQVSATPGGSAVVYLTTGTGDQFMWVMAPLPLGNVTNAVLNSGSDLAPGDVSSTITTYTSPSGVTGASEWLGATGNYLLVSSISGDQIPCRLTRGSNAIAFDSPLQNWEAGPFSILLLNTSVSAYRTYVSKADGNLYFTNGHGLGRILAENQTTLFNPAVDVTYTVSYAVVYTLQPSDTIVDMTDLKSTLVIAGQRDIYTWDYVSANMTAPSPVPETISSIINDLNNIYILAGQKGSIYISNGYSAQFYYKIPDYIAGIIDPVWWYGGTMVHRSKLFFQALAQDTAGTNILAGIFSLNVSSSDATTKGSIIMDNPNSYGLVPASTAQLNGLLIDNNPSSTGFDSYYSAWSSSSTAGGIDFNDTTLWANFEPIIETDIIPIGSFLDKKTLGLMEFKLDRPLVTGDQIKISARTSLSDTYTLLGTTTTATLSDYYSSNIFQAQWVQFKVQYKCASSGSSYIPLREIRVHII